MVTQPERSSTASTECRWLESADRRYRTRPLAPTSGSEADTARGGGGGVVIRGEKTGRGDGRQR